MSDMQGGAALGCRDGGTREQVADSLDDRLQPIRQHLAPRFGIGRRCRRAERHRSDLGT